MACKTPCGWNYCSSTPSRQLISVTKTLNPGTHSSSKSRDGNAMTSLNRRFENSVIRLLARTLPVLSNVQSLDISGYLPRKLAPSVATDLAVVLPNLKSVHWEFQDCDNLPACARVDNRGKFATALENIRLRDRSTAKIMFIHEFPLDQRLAGQKIVASGRSYDPFSAALQHLLAESHVFHCKRTLGLFALLAVRGRCRDTILAPPAYIGSPV